MSKPTTTETKIRAELETLHGVKEGLERRLGIHQVAAIQELADSEDDTERTQWAREWVRTSGRCSYLVSCLVHGILPSPLPGCWA